jgi:predicted enzyme related to lactoylglutathione lyase
MGGKGDELEKFYGALFAWEINSNNPMKYGIVDTGGAGGINGGVGADRTGGNHVSVYAEVDDLRATLDKAEKLGGKTILPPSEVPGGPELAMFADPAGNVTGLLLRVKGRYPMRISLTSVLVDDQAKALAFYTKTLMFAKGKDIPMGEYRFLTVVSSDHPGGAELLLEPIAFAPARTYQMALYEAEIPATSFAVEDIEGEHQRLTKMGVVFRSKPAKSGTVTVVKFDDTCGNLIQLHQVE